MDQFLKGFRRRTPVEEIIDEYAKEMPESGSTAEVVVVPDGYQLVKFQRPDGTIIAVRRKIATWQMARRNSVLSSRPRSPTGSFRTVISRMSDGSITRVQQPVRHSTPSARASSRLLQARDAQRSGSVSSSPYTGRVERDAMASTMTIVDAALADQLQSGQMRRHSRRDGSATTMSSGAAISGTSGDIHIGHIEDFSDEVGNHSIHSSSDYDEKRDDRSEDGQTEDYVARSADRNTYSSCAFGLETRVPPQHEMVSLDDKKLPSPPSTIYSPSRSVTSWGYAAKLRAHERHAFPPLPVPETKTGDVWVRRIIQCSSYLMSYCSIVLPAMFLVLGVIITFMNGHAVTPGWSAVDSVVGIAAAIWPVVFAAVVAQSFRTWTLFKAGRWTLNYKHLQVREPRKLLQHIEAICLLVFLVWCLSPIGSQALERAYRLTTETRLNSTNVWYVDRTGYNSMWSANSTSSMSAASRSTLMQSIGEQYVSSLVPNTMLANQNGPTNAYALPAPMLSGSGASEAGLIMVDSSSSPSPLSIRNIIGNSSLDPAVEAATETLDFSVTTSLFEFTCGNWNLMLRSFDNNTTSTTNMSYSESQTLGMSMASGDDSTTPRDTVRFVSLNKISAENGTILARRDNNGTSPHNEKWEYSSIQCDFQQHFYSEPVQCKRAQDASVGACVRSAQRSLILTSVGLPGTELGDFSQDFVSANLPTTGIEATATERYIQEGGSANPTSLAAKADNSLLLNLSSTVSPGQFAQNFGRLFNTWVSLGYCPQCESDILTGNTTVIAPNLQPFYRQVTATTVGVGDQIFTINWAWLTVFLVFACSLLIAGIASVAVESILAKGSEPRRRIDMERLRGGQPIELLLPKTCSAVNSGQSSPQWAQSVMQDIEAAASVEHSGHMYR